MKLTELNPRWVGAGGPGISHADGSPVEERHGVGLSFDCPCGCGDRVYVDFENPIDGRPYQTEHPFWKREGESFECLTLNPSILRIGGCRWHGWVRNGEVVNA